MAEAETKGHVVSPGERCWRSSAVTTPPRDCETRLAEWGRARSSTIEKYRRAVELRGNGAVVDPERDQVSLPAEFYVMPVLTVSAVMADGSTGLIVFAGKPRGWPAIRTLGEFVSPGKDFDRQLEVRRQGNGHDK